MTRNIQFIFFSVPLNIQESSLSLFKIRELVKKIKPETDPLVATEGEFPEYAKQPAFVKKLYQLFLHF